jgi:trehalose 6-phosphate phosphatase
LKLNFCDFGARADVIKIHARHETAAQCVYNADMKHLDFLPPPPALHSQWALFLDIDGTLLEFALRPESVVVPPDLPDILHRLADQRDGALALISGRAITEIDQFFAPHTLPAAGHHGLEWRFGAQHFAAATDAAALEEVEAAMTAFAADHRGVLVERKALGLGLHVRQAPHHLAAAQVLVTALAAQFEGRLVLQAGNHVFELRQPGGDKGQAVMRFMAAAPFSGRTPVFVGDDLTDEHAFKAVNMLGGLSILVGQREPTSAAYHLPDPAAVRVWLAQPLTTGSVAV